MLCILIRFSIIALPTRITSHSATIIDITFINSPTLISSAVICSDIQTTYQLSLLLTLLKMI